MVMALRRRLWRMFRENKWRYIGIVVLIMLGSLYFVAATGVSGNLERLVVGFAQQNMQEDLTFSTGRPIQNIAALERESGAAIEASLQYDARLPDGELRLLSLTSRINIPAVLSGRALEQPGEILLDPRFLQRQGLDIGGQIEISGKIFRIVGTMAMPNYVHIVRNVHDVLQTPGFGIGVVFGADIADTEEFVGARIVYAARFEDAQNIRAQLVGLFRLLTERGYAPSDWFDARSNIRINMPWGNISSMRSMSLPVAITFFLLSCFIAGMLLLRMIKSDSVVIGALYAQGFRRSELTAHYLVMPVLLSLAGGLVGILLGLLGAIPVLDSLLSFYILPELEFAVSPLDLALAVFLPTAFIAISCLLVLRSVLRKNAVELMKGDEQKARVNFIERSLRLERFRFSAKFQIREQTRSMPRLLFLLLGVSAASMVLLYGFFFNYSMDVSMRGTLARFNYAIEYNFREMQNERDRPVPEGAEPVNALRAHVDGRENIEFHLLGIRPNSAGLNMNGVGGAYVSRNQVNITRSLAARLRLSVGDAINFADRQDGRLFSLTIDGIIEDYGEQFIVMPIDDFNLMAGLPLGSYRTVLSSRELDFDGSLLSGIMDARDPDAFNELSGTTNMIIAATTAVSVLIAVVIIYLVTSLVIDESRSAISLLKVFGYSEKDIARLILNGSRPAVFAGFWLGLPLMLAFGNYLFSYIADVLNMLIPMAVNPLYVLIGLALITSVYEITKLVCARNIAKIPMSEALKAGAE